FYQKKCHIRMTRQSLTNHPSAMKYVWLSWLWAYPSLIINEHCAPVKRRMLFSLWPGAGEVDDSGGVVLLRVDVVLLGMQDSSEDWVMNNETAIHVAASILNPRQV